MVMETLTPMPRRYSYRVMATTQEWQDYGDLVLHRFLTGVSAQCKDKGYPLPPIGTEYRAVGLRVNAEGARDDRGELPNRLECDPNDRRAIEIELRIEWTK